MSFVTSVTVLLWMLYPLPRKYRQL